MMAALAAMVYLLRGVCFIYQGQEMGMLNSWHDSIDEFDDVESINKFEELRKVMSDEEALAMINFGGRDNTRRPMCWNGDGTQFTAGKPWMPFHSRMGDINLETDMAAEKSVWRFYRELLHLRANHKALTLGDFSPVQTLDTYCAYKRTYGDETILIVCNYQKEQEIALPNGQLLLSNYSLKHKHDNHFRPYEVAVYRL